MQYNKAVFIFTSLFFFSSLHSLTFANLSGQTATSVNSLPSGQAVGLYGAKAFEWELVATSEQIKDNENHEVNGVYSSLKNSLVYSITDQDQLRFYGSYVIEDYKKYNDKKYFEFAELMYRRKSILNYDEHGFNLDFELKYGRVVDTEIKKLWGFDSETIPQIILKKRLGNGFSVELKARHHFYHRNTNKARAIAHEDRFYLSGYKLFERKYLLGTELKFRHKIYTGRHYSYAKGKYISKDYEELFLKPNLMVFFDRRFALEGYLESKLAMSNDGRRTSELLKDEFLIGAALYLTIF